MIYYNEFALVCSPIRATIAYFMQIISYKLSINKRVETKVSSNSSTNQGIANQFKR